MATVPVADGPPEGDFRNFLRDDPDIRRFSYTDGTRHQMEMLARMMTFGSGTPEQDSDIPSGFTYLLQFTVHDLVDTSQSSLKRPPEPVRNNRREPLRLQTLYGEYDQGRAILVDDLLPIGPMRFAGKQPDGNDPRRDVQRNRLPDAQKPPFWKPVLADENNDSNVVLSQLTVLFSLLHNAFVQRLEDTGNRADDARRATTIVYRHILRHEVLPKIIHPAIWELYNTGFGPIDRGSAGKLPLEFSYGALRFGHAMVRNRYKVNREHDDRLSFTTDLLRATYKWAGPTALPLTAEWIVTWSEFFDFRGVEGFEYLPAPNFARRIGPMIMNVLNAATLFPQEGDAAIPGLIHRDLMRSAQAGLWSVPALVDVLREAVRLAPLLPDGDTVHAEVRTWLQDNRRSAFPLGDDEVAAIAADPPMSFYILLEAELARKAANADGVGTLGPLGSIIIAEVMLGILDQDDREFGKAKDPLDRKLALVSDAFKDCGRLDNMVALIRFVAEHPPRSEAEPAEHEPPLI
ncbi:MAG TPA: peroxidase family protein [Rhodopila sp.]|nr:peroxidase family protein [Rhodopila sp.]